MLFLSVQSACGICLVVLNHKTNFVAMNVVKTVRKNTSNYSLAKAVVVNLISMKVRLKFPMLLLVLIYTSVLSAQVTSFTNGDYSNNATWIGNAPNSQVDDVLIMHDVILDVSLTIKKNFDVQQSLVGTVGETIEVTNFGVLSIGRLDIDAKLTVKSNAQLTIRANDTAYVNDLILLGSAEVVIESGAVLYIDDDFEVRNTVLLTVQSGAEIHVGNDFILQNSTNPVINGDIFVTNNLSTKNTVAITGNGAITVGGQTSINNSSNVFGSTSPCSNCIYSNGCSYSSVINTWTGLADNDWFNALNWTTGVPTHDMQVRIPALSNPKISGNGAECFHLVVESNGSLEISGTDSLKIFGDATFDGSFISNSSIINFTGDCWPAQLSATDGTVTFYSVVLNNTNNLTIVSGNYELEGTLTVQNGVFETNDSLTLVSNASGTARIAEITGGGSITGEIEMQRYIDEGETYWRFFSSAVQGATIADYQGDFVTSGYVGSDFPSFPFTSVYTYIEGTGYAAVANANQVINQGQGVMVWSGDTITGTDPFVVDYRGVPNQGDINMPVTFSNTDGWNLLGNPYPSTINWDLVTGADRQNIANAIYILNPDTEQYATYINGASANGGSNLIPSQQAFWVGAIASNPVLTFRESIKSSVDQPFLKSGSPISSGVHILLSGFNKTDEAVIRHVDNATDGYDSEYDATKRFASWMEYPHVSVLNGDDVDYTVHSFDKAHQEWSLPIRTIVFQSGDYDITFSDLSELNVPCLMLEDTYTGQVYPIEESVPLTFTMSDTTYAPRFVLHIGKNYDIESTEALCHGDFGQVNIDLDNFESGTFNLMSGGNSIKTGFFAGNLQIDSLAAGQYTIVMSGLNNLCQTNQLDFEVVEPTELLVLSTITPETFGQDGAIELQIIGGTPGYSFAWSNGADSSVITGLTEGVYEVLVTDESNCSTSELFRLGSTLGIDNIEADETTKFVYFPEENRVSLSGELDLTYTLVDISGKMIAEYNVLNNAEQVNLELPNSMAKGIYILTGINNSFTLIK